MALFKRFTVVAALCLSGFFTPASAKWYVPTSEAICKPVDFRQTFPLEMRNQNNLAWCYAHSAADYLQFTYQLSEQISAADIAILYSNSKWSRFLKFFQGLFDGDVRREPAQTGLIKDAVKMIRAQGYCPESSLPSDEWTRLYSDGRTEKVEILKAVMDMYNLHTQVHKNAVPSAEDLPWRYQFKNIPTTQEFYNLLRSSKKSQLLRSLRIAACQKDRKRFEDLPIETAFRIKGPLTFARINGTMDWAKAPVSIDFFSDVLRNFDHPKRRIKDLHTTLLYGRRFNTNSGQCEYLIKDSYGPQCSKYDPQIACEAGYVWLPENKLYRALTSVYFMSRPRSDLE